MAPNKLFLIGPGLIGRAVLDLIKAEGNNEITCLSRRPEYSLLLRGQGFKTVAGSLDDFELIAQQSQESDVVIHTATADHLPSVLAVLEGIRRKIQAGKKGGIFIHTSGTGVLDDGANGQYKSETIFRDDHPEEIDALDPKAPHRPIDLAIAKAFREEFKDKARIAIVIPPTIYGYNRNHGRLTIQIPTLTRFALKHGFSGYVGEGKPVESQIHVNDLASGYQVLLRYIKGLQQGEVENVLTRNPYFFCENGMEFSWREVAENIGKGLKSVGKIADESSRPIPEDLWGDLFGPETGGVIGLNSRSRAVRLRELGWEPKEKGIWESYYDDELPAILGAAE